MDTFSDNLSSAMIAEETGVQYNENKEDADHLILNLFSSTCHFGTIKYLEL